MIVCICEGLNDKTLKAAIREGNTTLRSIRKACGAGGNCGSCVCDLKQMIREHSDKHQAPTRLISK